MQERWLSRNLAMPIEPFGRWLVPLRMLEFFFSFLAKAEENASPDIPCKGTLFESEGSEVQRRRRGQDREIRYLGYS